MKTFAKKVVSLFVISAAAVAAPHVHAGSAVPYTVDADTIHLWRFDNSTVDGSGFIETPDIGVGAALVLTNLGLPANTPPFTNIFITNISADAALNGCLNILPSDGGTTVARSHAMAAGPGFLSPTNFCNPTSGAFTFEALINCQGNIFNGSAGAGEWEIFCGDNSPGTGQSRGWQFRIQNGAVPSMNFNFITGSGGGIGSFTANLPTRGPDALAVGNWYHIAVTYTGNTPTNTDIPGSLTFYWTLFDPSRTNADMLTNYSVGAGAPGTLGGTPSPAVGGAQRTVNGVGNGGSFQGFIDEVRVSDIARAATNMAFNGSAFVAAPDIVRNPPATNTVGWGQGIDISTIVIGQSLTFQWQESNTFSGGWTNLALETNSDLPFNQADFTAAGKYRLIASNSLGLATSTVAQIIVGAVPSELYATGVDASGPDSALAGFADLHYFLTASSDIGSLGPSAVVWNMTAYPIAANGGNFANIDGVSQWVGTVENGGSAQGGYVFRTFFLLDQVDTTQPLTLTGTVWYNNALTSIRLNGTDTGNHPAATNSQNTPAAFTISSGFVPGLNTLDFYVTNNDPASTYQQAALRVEVSGLGSALAAGIPVVRQNPSPVTVSDTSLTGIPVTATFSVVATGRPPLTYQWLDQNGTAIAGATNRTLTYQSPSAGAQPTAFSCIVSNNSGAVTSTVASLTLLSTVPAPVLSNYGPYQIYTNQTLNLVYTTLVSNATDLDHLQLSSLGVSSVDANGTNGLSTVTLTGDTITYTPGPGVTGADAFHYYIQDLYGDIGTGTITVNVVAPIVPPVSAARSGKTIIFGGTGAAPNGSYHVYSTTNIALPLTNWTVTGPFSFDSSGNFSVTNSTTNAPQRIFLISVP